MANTSFTISALEKAFALTANYETFTQDFQPIAPSAWLLQTQKNGHKSAFVSEKSRCETIVSPILLDVQQNNPDKIGIYSGVSLDDNKNLGLKGECDFILGLGKQSERPFFAW